MKLTALMPVRNEAWCLGLSARVALQWCDEIVILLHACTDTSGMIAEQLQREHRGRVHILVETEDKWDEMRHRQELLCGARSFGATHVAMVDADEILINHASLVRMWATQLDAGKMLQLPLYNTRGSISRYHANGLWGNRWVSIAFVDDVRLRWSGDTFHRREPEGLSHKNWRPMQHGNGGVVHLWGASLHRLRAKQALYKMTEALRWPSKSRGQIDAYYSQSMLDLGWKFNEMPESWWAGLSGLLHHLDADAPPWQQQKCEELWKQYGPEPFAGLDLFGVVR